MVVSVVVGFLKKSMSSVVCCLVIRRSKKLVVLFISYVGVNVRLGCISFRYLLMLSAEVCSELYIMSRSSTYLV